MNKLNILKTFAPGFLPLLIFIVADSIWGTEIGLIVAVVSGILEMAYSYFKEKFLDKFILLDTGLIVAMGGVSIALNDPIFFKLKPALIELIFCFIIAVSVFSPVNMMIMMASRYMKNMKLSEEQIKQMNSSLRVLLYLFLLHTALIVYSAFFMSKGAWAFISGGLFYIIFGVYFVFEILRKKIKQKQIFEKYKNDEWFDIVDEEGNVKGKAPRTLCHSGPGMLHPVVHMHLIDSRNRIYLQKRNSDKKIQPGKWDTAVGGHVSSGESVEDALVRETEEEIGLKDVKPRFIGMYKWETEIESELVYMFVSFSDKKPFFNTDEIEDGKFWKIKKIKESLNDDIFTPNFKLEFEILLKHIIR